MAADFTPTTIYYVPESGFTTTVQYSCPIEPTAVADLPLFTVDSIEADVFPLTYTSDGLVDAIQIVCSIPSASGTSVVQRVLSHPSPLAMMDTDLTTHLQTSTALPARFSLRTEHDYAYRDISMALNGSPIHVHRHGKHVYDAVWYLKATLSSTTADPDLGCWMYITRYADKYHFIYCIGNDIYDPTQTHTSANTAVAGDATIHAMKFWNFKNTWDVKGDWDDGVKDYSALGSGRPSPFIQFNQYITYPGRIRYPGRFTLIPTGGTYTGWWAGYAYGDGGGASQSGKRWYGGRRDVMPLLDSDFAYDTDTGSTAATAFATAHLADTLSHLNASDATVNADLGYELARQGWWRPWGPADSSIETNTANFHSLGWLRRPQEWAANYEKLITGLFRHATGLHNIDGTIIYPSQLLISSKIAWHVSIIGPDCQAYIPHFIDANAYGTRAVNGGWPLKPTGNPWNTTSHASIVTYSSGGRAHIQPFGNHDYYAPFTGISYNKLGQVILNVATFINDSFSAWILRSELSHIQLSLSNLDSDNVEDASLAEPYHPYAAIADAVANAQYLDGAGGNAGLSHTGGGESQFGIALGNLLEAAGDFYRFITPTESDPSGNTRREELMTWAEKLAEYCDYMIGPANISYSTAYNTGFDYSDFPHNATYHGTTSIGTNSGALTALFMATAHRQMAIAAWGAYSFQNAIKPIVTAGPSENVNKFRGVYYNLIDTAWREVEEGDGSGDTTRPPQYFYITRQLSSGTADLADYPLPQYKVWYWPDTGNTGGGYAADLLRYHDNYGVYPIVAAAWADIDANIFPQKWLNRLARLMAVSAEDPQTVAQDAALSVVYTALQTIISYNNDTVDYCQQVDQFAWSSALGLVYYLMNNTISTERYQFDGRYPTTATYKVYYPGFKEAVMTGGFSPAAGELVVALLLDGTTAFSDTGVMTYADFTDLDELSGSIQYPTFTSGINTTNDSFYYDIASISITPTVPTGHTVVGIYIGYEYDTYGNHIPIMAIKGGGLPYPEGTYTIDIDFLENEGFGLGDSYENLLTPQKYVYYTQTPGDISVTFQLPRPAEADVTFTPVLIDGGTPGALDQFSYDGGPVTITTGNRLGAFTITSPDTKFAADPEGGYLPGKHAVVHIKATNVIGAVNSGATTRVVYAPHNGTIEQQQESGNSTVGRVDTSLLRAFKARDHGNSIIEAIDSSLAPAPTYSMALTNAVNTEFGMTNDMYSYIEMMVSSGGSKTAAIGVSDAGTISTINGGTGTGITVEVWVQLGEASPSTNDRWIFANNPSSGTTAYNFVLYQKKDEDYRVGFNVLTAGPRTAGETTRLTKTETPRGYLNGTDIFHIVAVQLPDVGTKVYAHALGKGFRGVTTIDLDDLGDCTNWSSTGIFCIGADNNAPKTNNLNFKGKVYFAALHNKALTSAEIARNFYAGPPKPYDAKVLQISHLAYDYAVSSSTTSIATRVFRLDTSYPMTAAIKVNNLNYGKHIELAGEDAEGTLALTWAAGAANADYTINIPNLDYDDVLAAIEIVPSTVDEYDTYIVGTEASSTLLLDIAPKPAPMIALSNEAITVFSGTGLHTIPVIIHEATPYDLTLTIAVDGSSTATNGVHYTVVTPTVFVPAGSTTASIVVNIL